MKQLLCPMAILLFICQSHAQVTQINADKSLAAVTPLNNTLALFQSEIDQTLWVSNGTQSGTFILSADIKFQGYGSLLNGKFIFKGYQPATGTELFITDGTKSGTKLLKDINPGTGGSQPIATTMATLNGYVYFAAVTPGEGCELWRTDGTDANTKIIKAIGAGAISGIDSSAFSITATATRILFSATDANGLELWASDGTAANTVLVKDIVPGNGSSNPRTFYPFGNINLFTVTAANNTTAEIWRTDGTGSGTIQLLSNISPGFLGANNYSAFFHIFKNNAYFMVDDNVHAGAALWRTDGQNATSSHTSFIKELGDKTLLSAFFMTDAFNLSDKFIFPFGDALTVSQLWQSDGTASGTTVFKSFPLSDDHPFPVIYSSFGYDASTQTQTYPLYNGKFFFSAYSDTQGNELWMTDGTAAGTQIVKDINPAKGDGINDNISWFYTPDGLFFVANNGQLGNELWKTNATVAGTTMVQDIFTGGHNANPVLYFVNNGKLFFSAFDPSPADSSVFDLFVVSGTFGPLPVQLLNFTVTPKENDALLQWSTAQELNVKDYTIQSSDDGQYWNTVGTVVSAGNSSQKKNYSFTDANVMNSGKNKVYYRLVTTDVDGKTSHSEIISLKIENGETWNVQFYTNPVRGDLKIMLTGINGEAKISIYNIIGKQLYTSSTENKNGWLSIPVNLNNGVYILKVEYNGKTRSLKFVKD